MNKEHIKGAFEKAKGTVKHGVGGLTGRKKMQAEGKMDKMKGSAHKATGDGKRRREGREEGQVEAPLTSALVFR